MSETSGCSSAKGENLSMGLDFFGLYTSEVAELLAQDEDLVPFSHKKCEKGTTKSSYPTKEKDSFGSSSSLYSNGVGASLSEFRRERLKILLRQSVFTLAQEVNEVINPIISLCRLRSCLRYKDSLLLSSNGLSLNTDDPKHPHKKPKALSSSSSLCNVCGIKLTEDLKKGSTMCPDHEIDDDMRVILENDSTKVEQFLKQHSDEFFSMLQHMEQKLEELLDNVMKTCRPMTPNEKQELRKRIKELPPINVGRVAEILGESKTRNEVYVDLDSKDQITLWRLYFYVAAVQNAKTL